MILFKDNIMVFRVYKKGNKQIELCIFPPFKGEISCHYHKEEYIELMHLWGFVTYRRIYKGLDRSHTTTLKDTGRKFSIPSESVHSAFIGWSGLITLSIQTWKTEVKSVTKDYYEVNPPSVDFNPVEFERIK